MFFEDLAEACKVESLVVLQQDQAQVELAEGQLQVVEFPCPVQLLVFFLLEEADAGPTTAQVQRRRLLLVF